MHSPTVLVLRLIFSGPVVLLANSFLINMWFKFSCSIFILYFSRRYLFILSCLWGFLTPSKLTEKVRFALGKYTQRHTDGLNRVKGSTMKSQVPLLLLGIFLVYICYFSRSSLCMFKNAAKEQGGDGVLGRGQA